MHVNSGEHVTSQDAILVQTTTVEGKVYNRADQSAQLPISLWVGLRNPNTGSVSSSVETAADGSFHMYGVVAGTYEVCVDASLISARSCIFDGSVGSNPTVTISDGQIISDINIPIDFHGAITGRVLSRTSSASPATPLASGEVTVYKFDGTYFQIEETVPIVGDGTFQITQLESGDYVLRFSDNYGVFNSEYWQDQRYFYDSTVIHVDDGSIVELADSILDTRSIDVSRISGNSRFDVGVNVSKQLYPEGSVPTQGIPVVYIANGYNFPDALTASPAAALVGGVVLLVEPDSIPSEVAAEIQRLRPSRIIVAGGWASVSPRVFDQLSTYVASPSDISREGGSDRYEASRSIVRDAFSGTGSDYAIIATGANYPDALSAGPAASSIGAPVILVDGSESSLDQPTAQLLADLGVKYVAIAGGTGSVNPGIEASLKGLLGTSNVYRVAGKDRFEVAVLISKLFFAEADYAYVATGYKFPDALTGGPLAANNGAPLLLSPPECLPNDVFGEVMDLDAQSLVLLGGPGSLSTSVENLTLCNPQANTK